MEIECNNFKPFIETFFNQIKTMKKDVNESVKSARQKAAKIYEAVCMESMLVFNIDDKPILGIDTPISSAIRSNSWETSVTLSRAKNRKKRHLADVSSSKEKLNAEFTIILADSIEKSASKLANVFLASKSTST